MSMHPDPSLSMAEQLKAWEVERDRAQVVIEYKVPLYVTVNVETGEVDQVRVNDEIIGEPIGFYQGGNGVKAPTPENEAKAREVIGSDAEWPAWEFGT